jgi:hypothetical protein
MNCRKEDLKSVFSGLKEQMRIWRFLCLVLFRFFPQAPEGRKAKQSNHRDGTEKGDLVSYEKG